MKWFDRMIMALACVLLCTVPVYADVAAPGLIVASPLVLIVALVAVACAILIRTLIKRRKDKKDDK